ncbi:MAG TPA: glycosyltransferase family 2 protein [Blastocatellia bacterium]|nr:glycosyltransferase family 2 protein [Blastocatellia bacterium]
MPCLNEAETLEVCIAKASRALAELNLAGEIIVADNGSTDGSQGIASKMGARLVSAEAKGYGSALMAGISAARGRFIIMGDADDSYDFSELKPFVEKLRSGYDLVMGNRFKGGIAPGAMPALHRYLGNPVLTAIGRLFFHSPAGDFHCGLRGFHKAAVMKMDLRTTGMEFASEMVVKATLQKMRIAEVPVTLSPDGRSRRPHLRRWRDGWRHLRFLLLYSPRWLFLYPGLLLMLGGLVAGSWLLSGPIYIGRVGFDVQTLLYAAVSVVIGFQAMIFALFTKVFAISEGLLPEDPRIYKLFQTVTLERGIITGIVLVLGGLAGSIYAVSFWDENAFGPLDPSKTLRIIIPSITALIVGCQTILSSFFLSVLVLRRR